VTPQNVRTTQDEYIGLSEGSAQAREVRSLGDLPVIVLSRGLNNDSSWTKGQTRLLKLSSNSEQLVASHSDHNIERDEPKAAVDAVGKMLGIVRNSG
jgi:hypothetical protein